MKGRGARTIAPADFQAVTPDAHARQDRFVIVDAVGVTEHDFVEPPLNRDRSVSLQQLLEKAASLTITEDETATLASRLAALELQLTDSERAELDHVAGQPLKRIVRGLVDAIDPDHQTVALEEAGQDASREEVIDALIEQAVSPLAANPELRSRIMSCAAHMTRSSTRSTGTSS